VNRVSAGLFVSSSPNPSEFNQTATFTASFFNDETPGLPTGMVTFREGTTVLGQANIAAGFATFNLTTLSPGSHDITAEYPGDANFNPTTASVTHSVNRAATSIDLTSTPNPSVVGQLVTFTATITSTGGMPTGAMTVRDGAASIGTATINANGQAIFTTSSLAAGTHTISFVYAGNSTFAPGFSNVVSQTVNTTSGNATTTSVTSSPNPSLVGQPVTFIATVTAGAGTPTGFVTFRIGSIAATAPLNSSGLATFTIATLAEGSHQVTVEYGGFGGFGKSTSPTNTHNVLVD